MITRIYYKSGYTKHATSINIIKGITLGTISLLIIYALLPDSLRFSRALIVLGTISSTMGLIIVRKIIKLISHTKKTNCL